MWYTPSKTRKLFEDSTSFTQPSPNTCVILSFIKLNKNLSKGISSHKYYQIIGSLLNLTNFSRPKIIYAIGRLRKYTNNPNHSHWTALEMVFR